MTDGTKALGHLKTARSSTPRPEQRPRRHTVTLVAGDGIGEEVAQSVAEILDAAEASVGWDRCLAGQRAQAKFGTPLPEALLESIRTHKVALMGRLGAPLAPLDSGAGPSAEPPNVLLRKRLDLFASVRPARSMPGMRSRYEGIDLVVIRECTEDVYAGIEHEVVPGVVESLKVVTQAASLRIARFAFEYAVREKRRTVTCVHKANIMKMSDGLFLTSCREIAREYPGVAFKEAIADSCIMQLVLDPRRFDVLVMGNLLGDIISDLCAGLVGGIGTVPGINVGEGITVFEAIHGNAPHLEGEDRANPL
ncbi:MAG TPA: isocitrate/isopropylmalate family dehydrogenase, partial [Candidatus Polarisedimenticolia bacterium]|nr:isocitrate/isopropylmalate family dehydrogenase [Candidatus Polarisedimenticolia bacterium]